MQHQRFGAAVRYRTHIDINARSIGEVNFNQAFSLFDEGNDLSDEGAY